MFNPTQPNPTRKYLSVVTRIFVIVLLISACGDSSPTDPGLTFNTSAPEQKYDIQKFKNADWLYESYFGEFNLPPWFKDQISVELQMVANGFALAEAKGEDVVHKMKFADTVVRETFVTQMVDEVRQEERREKTAEEDNAAIINEPEGNSNDALMDERPPEYHPPIEDPEFEAFKAEQDEMVKKYNLPYPLPNDVILFLVEIGWSGSSLLWDNPRVGFNIKRKEPRDEERYTIQETGCKGF